MLDQFGLNPLLLAAQIVNFLVLLYILKRFLYKPLLKVLEERKKIIVESLQNAQEIEERLNKITEEREKRLTEASKEAKTVVEDATKASQAIVAQAHEKASVETQKMLKKAQEAMNLEREQLHDEIRSELASLVISSLEKVTGKVLSEKDQKELVEKSLRGIKI